MRIKEVCRETGLTDKAVRFYINNHLINPTYSENYSGRRNYSFDDNDVEMLKMIALLRKYNFSINNIKEMQSNSESIPEVLENHILQTNESAAETSFILTNLNNAASSCPTSLESLCEKLSENLEPETFDLNKVIKELWTKLKRKIPKIVFICISGLIISIIIIVLITLLLSKLFIALY